MSDLLPRLRAATGPDRTLDAEIACVVRAMPRNAPEWLKRWSGPFAPISYKGSNPGQIAAMHSDGKAGVNWTSPEFTASVDAALTLVPDGAYWTVAAGKTRPDEPLYGCVIQTPGGQIIGLAETDISAALAICIAAMEARKG